MSKNVKIGAVVLVVILFLGSLGFGVDSFMKNKELIKYSTELNTRIDKLEKEHQKKHDDEMKMQPKPGDVSTLPTPATPEDIAFLKKQEEGKMTKTSSNLTNYKCWDFTVKYNPSALQIGYMGVSDLVKKSDAKTVADALESIQPEKLGYCKTLTNADGSKYGYISMFPAGTPLPCYGCDGGFAFIDGRLDSSANEYNTKGITNSKNLTKTGATNVRTFDYDSTNFAEGFPLVSKVYSFTTKNGTYSFNLHKDSYKNAKITQDQAEKQFQDLIDNLEIN